jgi:hypothetical protein
VTQQALELRLLIRRRHEEQLVTRVERIIG